MNITKRARYGAMLPATPCTAELREKMVKIAQQEEASLAEVQRTAFEFFLSNADKLLISHENQLSETEES